VNVEYNLEVSRATSLSTHFEMVYTFKDGTIKFDSGNPRRPVFEMSKSCQIYLLLWMMKHQNGTSRG
jgi:hypothetical protein